MDARTVAVELGYQSAQCSVQYARIASVGLTLGVVSVSLTGQLWRWLEMSIFREVSSVTADTVIDAPDSRCMENASSVAAEHYIKKNKTSRNERTTYKHAN